MKTAEYSIGLKIYHQADIACLVSEPTPKESCIPVYALENDSFIPKQRAHALSLMKPQALESRLLKTVICVSPLLYAAYCTRQRLEHVVLFFYHKNISGEEEEYYRIILENVNLITAIKLNKDAYPENAQQFTMRFEKIEWEYVEYAVF